VGLGVDRTTETLALHTRLAVYQRHVDQAVAIVRACLADGPVGVCFSGGKDSLVLLHLAHQVDGRISGYFFDSGCETSWTHATVQAMRDRGVPVTTLHPQHTIIEMIQMVGGLGYDGPQKLDGQWHWGAQDFKRVLMDGPDWQARERVAAAWLGPVTMLIGLRGEESRARRVHLATRTPRYTRTDGRRFGCPLAWWTGRDVLAYAQAHDLPLSREYRQAGEDVDTRARRRTGTALGTSGVGYGRWARVREEHPALWQGLVALFPAMRWEG
jgi:3'-phosphoadenosine 5'-phosphosulfate sulfotransferase (PAPS reductase)/FAD synthetase